MNILRTCHVVDLGVTGYADALLLQQRLAAARKAGAAPDVLLLCEHPHVLTLGRNGKPEHLRVGQEQLDRLGVEFHPANRGGDITYHGPGQAVGYPILDLGEIRRDVGWYVRALEETMIRASAAFGVPAGRVAGCTGVWTGLEGGAQQKEKLGAIGVHLSRWVTSHGFAYNVSPELRYFDLIVPCGIAGCRTTSLEKLLGRKVSVAEAQPGLVAGFGEALGLRMLPARREEMETWFAASPQPAAAALP